MSNISAFLFFPFCFSSRADINLVDDVRILKQSVDSNFTIISFLDRIHASDRIVSFICGKFSKNNQFMLTSFLAILSRFYRMRCVQRVSLCSTFLFLCR